MSRGDDAHAGRRGRGGGRDRTQRWDHGDRGDGSTSRGLQGRAGRARRDCRPGQARWLRRNRRDLPASRGRACRVPRDRRGLRASRDLRVSRSLPDLPVSRALRRLVLLGPLLVLLLLGGAGPASAHAALGSTDPADGTVLQRAPGHVTLTFSESVGLRDDSFRVLDPGGHRVRTGAAGHADGRSDTAGVALPDGLGRARTPWPGGWCPPTATRCRARSPSPWASRRRRPHPWTRAPPRTR